MVRVALQAGVRNPGDVRAVLQVLGHSQSVLGVALGTQTERLDTENQLLGGKGVEGGADITQELDSGADDEGDGAKGLPELEAVVALGGLDELGESLAVLAPVKLARVDNDASDGGAVSADPFGSGVDDDVGAVLNGANKVSAGTKGVVDLIVIAISLVSFFETRSHGLANSKIIKATYHQGHALVVGYLGNGLQVRYVVSRVADALEEDGLCVVVDGGGNVLGVVALDKLGGDAVALEGDLELVVGAAVEVRGGDDVVAGLGESSEGDELGCLARGGGQSSSAPFKGCYPLLKDIDGGLTRETYE